MKAKTNFTNKTIKLITFSVMDIMLCIHAFLFIHFDVPSNKEALVNYVITFIVSCMTRLLTSHYLTSVPDDEQPNNYYMSVLSALYIYSFTNMLKYCIPKSAGNIVIIHIVMILLYCSAIIISLSYGLFFIQYYSISKKGKKIIRKLVWVTYTIALLIAVTSSFTKLVFDIDKSGNVTYPATTYIIDSFSMLWFIVSVVLIVISKQSRKTKIALLSYSIYATLFLVIDIILVNININMDSVILIGILLSIYTVSLTVYVEDKVELAEKKYELREKQTQIMISQIQPHFLYNTLSAIYVLCGDDPKLAQKTIKDFSLYLRHNMNSLNSSECVPFEKEMEHTKTYLAIESLRFADLLNVEYDIQYTDFELPPLSLQPIVENAVKYGIRSRENGGTVTVKTYKENDKIYIVVKDDGVGFDVNKPHDDDRSHLGIENTKNRLNYMCNGDLIIESVPDVGTTVTIILEDTNEYTAS